MQISAFRNNSSGLNPAYIERTNGKAQSYNSKTNPFNRPDAYSKSKSFKLRG